MAKEDFSKGGYAAGRVVTIRAKVAADDYYRGMVLAHDDSSQTYEAYVSTQSDGTQKPRAIFYEGNGEKITVSAEREALILVCGSEFLGEGLKKADGTALTADAALKQQFLEIAQIIIR